MEVEDLRVVLLGRRPLVSRTTDAFGPSRASIGRDSSLRASMIPELNTTSAPSHPRPKWRSNLDRDVVSVALSYFDRYVSRHGPFIAETIFELVAMTLL